MAEDIFGKDSEKDKTTPAEDPNKAILDSITSLKTDLDSINTRLDEFDTKLNAATTTDEEEPQSEGWKPKTWDEIPERAKEVAESVVEQKLSERDQAAKDAEKAKQLQDQRMDTFIDNQMADLEKNGVLPKIENAADENDAGRSARRELLGFAARIGTLDLNRASEVLKILHDNGQTYDPRANNMQGQYLRSGGTPVGINAPVASSNRPVGSAGNKPDYKTLHGASMDTLIKLGMPDYS